MGSQGPPLWRVALVFAALIVVFVLVVWGGVHLVSLALA